MVKVFVIYDSKVELYEQPVTMRTKGEALRMFIDLVNDRGTKFYAHPEDYTLFEIADYDEQTGKLIPHDAKISIAHAIEYKKDQQVKELK